MSFTQILTGTAALLSVVLTRRAGGKDLVRQDAALRRLEQIQRFTMLAFTVGRLVMLARKPKRT